MLSILGNYMVYRVLLGSRGRGEYQKRNLYLTTLGVGVNLGVLFYYKYFDFFLENVNAVFHMDFAMQHVLLPLGISFFTFQQVGFLIDTYRGETGNYSFVDYALFVTFFPQLIAGPIVTHEEMIVQFQDGAKKRWNPGNASRGVYAFVCGLAKKVLVADIFGKAVTWGFDNLETISGLTVILVIISYSIQLYFDFSGYSDMARGIGFLFNIEIPVNFFSPYKAVHLVDFWKRWHITLTRFFTKYVYIPLGGNRKGTLRTYFNIFMIYLVSGIWHGAGWTFLCWGALHGAVYVLTRRFFFAIERIPKAIKWFLNIAFIFITFAVFRAESMGQAMLIFRKAFDGSYALSSVPAAFAEQFRTPEFFYCLKLLHPERFFGGALTGAAACDIVLLAGYMAAAWFMILCCRNVNEKIEAFYPTAAKAVWISVLFLWSLVSFSEVSVFLYFNF